MKKLILILALYSALMVWGCTAAFGQTLKTSTLGIQYWISIPSTPGKYPIAFYACGGGSPAENPQNSVFFKQFMPANKDKFICVASVMPSGRTGWDYPVDQAKTIKAGAYLARYIHDTYVSQSDGTFHGGGWSAGGSYNFWFDCRDFITTLTICAGLGDMNTIREFGKSKIPGRDYNGTSDGAMPIDKVRYAVSQYGPTMTLIEIPGGNHSSAPAKAYATGGDLAAWYLSFSKPVEPPINPVSDYPAKKIYLSNGVIKFEFENGETKTVKPDD